MQRVTFSLYYINPFPFVCAVHPLCRWTSTTRDVPDCTPGLPATTTTLKLTRACFFPTQLLLYRAPSDLAKRALLTETYLEGTADFISAWKLAHEQVSLFPPPSPFPIEDGYEVLPKLFRDRTSRDEFRPPLLSVDPPLKAPSLSPPTPFLVHLRQPPSADD